MPPFIFNICFEDLSSLPDNPLMRFVNLLDQLFLAFFDRRESGFAEGFMRFDPLYL